jgi:hypothetical protein
LTRPIATSRRSKTYWLRNDGYGSWQARRELVGDLFEPLYVNLLRMEEQSFDALVDPISPRSKLGWPEVDEEIRELRRRSETASTAQDYRDIGNRCVTVTEMLGDAVYDPLDTNGPERIGSAEARPRSGSTATSS